MLLLLFADGDLCNKIMMMMMIDERIQPIEYHRVMMLHL